MASSSSSSSFSMPLIRIVSSMASTSSSGSMPSPSSPPHLPISSPPHSLASDSKPRNPYHDPSSPPHETTHYHRFADKRRKVEANRNDSLLHGFDLRPIATSLLESNDVEPLLIFIHEFTQLPIKKKHAKKKVFDSLSLHYPNSFLLKLAKLLSLNPPLHIRNEVVSLLQETLVETHGNDCRRIRCDMFVELKSLILESFKIELQETLLPQLTTTIVDLAARIYEFQIGGWVELLEYIFSCVSSNSDDELKLRKGLMLLAGIPNTTVEHRVLWKNHYSSLHENLVNRLLFESPNEDSHALTFDSMLKMLGIAQPLREYEIGDSILLILLEFIDQPSKEEIVVKRVQDLRDFVSMDVDVVLSGKEGIVFQAMLRIAEKNDASKELRCAAVQVLKDISNVRWNFMETIKEEISDVNARRVVKVSMDMMIESESYKQSSELGQFLLNLLSFKDYGSLVIRMAAEFLRTTYAASKDWRKCHTVMIVVAPFADGQQNISGSVFTTELIKMIADEINLIRERAQEAGNPGTAKRGSKYLPDEEMIQGVKLFISTTTETFKDRLSPYAEELFSIVAQLWGHDIPDRVKAIAVSFFNIIVPHFPDKWQKYHDIYTNELLKARDGSLHAQLESARGIGICAKFGGHNFKTFVNVAMLKLYSLIEHGLSIKGEESGDGAMIFDMAVSAIGKIIEFHRGSIDGPEVIRGWLNCLPLMNDHNEARIVHGQLSQMLKRKDADVLGPKKENIPKIISILRAILHRSGELATEETFSEIVKFLDKHGGGLF